MASAKERRKKGLITISKRKAKKLGFNTTNIKEEALRAAERRVGSTRESQVSSEERVAAKTARVTQQKPDGEQTRIEPVEQQRVVEQPVIKLGDKETKKSGIEKFAETPVGKVLSSPNTTAALAGGLAAVATAGTLPAFAATVRIAAPAIITQTAKIGSKSLTTQRAFIGKSTSTGVNKIFHASRNVARRYPTNVKSTQLTNQFLSKISNAPGLLLATIGTYPFAGFIKEEALQTLSFATFSAEKNNDVEGMEAAINEQEEILNPTTWNQLINSVPYANVVSQLNAFYKAALVKLENDKRTLKKMKGGEE